MLTIQDIKKITKATLVCGDPSMGVTGVSINSRTIKKGNVFIAIKGQKFDGHDFVRAAIRNGASAIIVSNEVKCSNDIAVIYVKNTTKALGQIAAWHRQRFNIPVIAITGSAGKTTTKELIACVLESRFKVLKNIGTENNHFGVPLTLLNLNSSHDIAVLELGTNQPGDIRWLAQIVKPQIVVFTNIGASHLEGLKSEYGVFKEKAQLIKHMDPGGYIILNGDDRYLRTISRQRKNRKIISFGYGKNVDHQASRVVVRNNDQLQFKTHGHTFIIHSPAVHNVVNALAAISCGLVSKIRYNDIIAALGKFKFCGARQEIKRIGRSWLIDDTYNANPMSFKSAINTLAGLHIDGKRIAICADMLELGKRSRVLHQSIGKLIAQSSIDMVLTIGRHSRNIAQILKRSNGVILSVHCNDFQEIHRRLKRFCRPGDAVLVKGSRGMHMEKTVTFLSTYLK